MHSNASNRSAVSRLARVHSCAPHKRHPSPMTGSESDAQSERGCTECAGMHTHAQSTGRKKMQTSAQECTHDLETRKNQDECTRMHTNAYAYTTAFAVHYNALQVHSIAFTYIREHPRTHEPPCRGLTREGRTADAHRCAEVRGSAQECTKNARGECSRMQTNATHMHVNARKRNAQTPPLFAQNPPSSGG